MTTKKDGKKIIYNALHVLAFTPHIQDYLNKNDFKALQQLRSAIDICEWAMDYKPEPTLTYTRK